LAGKGTAPATEVMQNIAPTTLPPSQPSPRRELTKITCISVSSSTAPSAIVETSVSSLAFELLVPRYFALHSFQSLRHFIEAEDELSQFAATA